MLKKLLWAAAIAGLAYFVIFIVPDLIREKKMDDAVKEAERDEYVKERAGEIADKKDDKKEGPEWGWGATEKAKDRYDRATDRSFDYAEEHGL